MANYTTTITNEGAALLASVIANQGTLTFNEFRFSENDYTGQESTLTEGTFLGVFITASAAASVIDLTTIKASAQFDNSTITGNHDLYSIGIIGTDGNTTALIAVCTTTDPDVIREPLTGTSTYAFNVNLSVSDTSQITVVGTTAAVIYDIDVIDNLTSTATNKPLSANQGRVLNEKVESLTNPNLLDNPWFTVNQRGTTSGNFEVGYTVDRWKCNYSSGGTLCTWSLSSSGITLDNTNGATNPRIEQLFESTIDATKIYTISVLFSDGTIESITGSPNLQKLTSKNVLIQLTSTQFGIFITQNVSATIRAVKLELGSVSTLANDVEPNYTAELLKCQRYFNRILSNSSSAFMAVGFMADSHTFYGTINLSVPMRGTPTSLFGGVLQIYTTGGAEDVSTLLINMRSPQILTIAATIGNSLTVNSPAILMGAANSYIDISADL